MNIVKDNWYESFFQGNNCEIWENAISEEWTEQEVTFLLNEFKLHQGQHLLDILCGFGRHSINLAKKGFQVTGIDISESFIKTMKNNIDLIQKNISFENLKIEVIQADILSYKLDKNKYDGAFCLGNCFGYFDYEKMKTFISNISYSLKPSSKLIINSAMIAESIIPNFPKNKSFNVGNILMEISNSYNVKDSFMISEIRYTKNGIIDTQVFKHFVYTMGEINRLLQLSGLTTIGVYKSLDRSEFELGAQQIYIVSEKE